MRSKNAIRNIIISLIYEILLFSFGIIMPRLIIISYGSEINGLTATINQILNIINLLQAGAIGASIYLLYKPIATNDYTLVNDIIKSSKRYFVKIGLVYLILSIGIAIITSFYLSSQNLKNWEILVSFIILTFAGSSSFFFISTSDILFSAFQNRWILNIASIIERIVYYLILFFVFKYNLHFIYMYIGVFVGRLAQVVVLKTIELIKYGFIINNREVNLIKIPNRGYLLLSSISEQIMISSPTLLVTYNLGLKFSSVYSIYGLVYNTIITIINAIQLSISAVFGNLVALGNNNEIQRVFNLICYFFIMFGTFLGCCSVFLFIPFISLYTHGITDNNYIYPVLSILISLSILSYSIKTPFSFISTIYGFFKYTYKVLVICGVIGVICSYICLFFFGFSFVFTGVLIYHIFVTLMFILLFRKKIEWNTTKKLLLRITMMLICTSLFYYFSINLSLKYDNWLDWIINAFFSSSVAIIIILIYSIIFENAEMRQFLIYFRKTLLKPR